MTINGPAPMILAFFMNAAIDQNVEKITLKKINQFELKVDEKLKAKFDDKGLKDQFITVICQNLIMV